MIVLVPQLILPDQPPCIATFTRRALIRKSQAPRNSIVVQHQLEFLHLIEHLKLRDPLQFPRLDVRPPDLAQRQRLRSRKAQTEEPPRERGKICVWLYARERHAARLCVYTEMRVGSVGG